MAMPALYRLHDADPVVIPGVGGHDCRRSGGAGYGFYSGKVESIENLPKRSGKVSVMKLTFRLKYLALSIDQGSVNGYGADIDSQ